MARNVEIKARVQDLDALHRHAAALADRSPEELQQDDTFFACAEGRLKPRDFGNGHGVLIAYRRADTHGPKLSDYLLCPTDAPAQLRDTLSRALGTIGRVCKQRSVYLVGPTRIHLDRVEGLGSFLELEVVPAEGVSAAQRRARGSHRICRVDCRSRRNSSSPAPTSTC